MTRMSMSEINSVFSQMDLATQDQRDRFLSIGQSERPSSESVLIVTYLSNNSQPIRGTGDAKLERTPE